MRGGRQSLARLSHHERNILNACLADQIEGSLDIAVLSACVRFQINLPLRTVLVCAAKKSRKSPDGTRVLPKRSLPSLVRVSVIASSFMGAGCILG